MPHPEPTHVALYTCIHDDANPITVMTALRETANAHGWVVIASLYDTGPLSRPAPQRLAWRTVTQLAATRRIQGIVAPDRHHVDSKGLAKLDAFTAYRTRSAASTSPPHHYRTTLAAERRAVSEARHTLTARLREWHVPNETTHTAELILSELATNAIVHTHGPEITVTVTHTPGQLRLAVTDHSPARPRLSHFEHPEHREHSDANRDPHGRGLHLVATLASCWGCSLGLQPCLVRREREDGVGHGRGMSGCRAANGLRTSAQELTVTRWCGPRSAPAVFVPRALEHARSPPHAYSAMLERRAAMLSK